MTYFLLLDLKEIKMIVNGGGKGRVRLQLQQLPQWQLCTTNEIAFSTGGTLIWNSENLGVCKNFKFDSAIATLDYWIKAENNDEFCPTSVELVSNDDQNTTYSLEKDMDCNYSRRNTNQKQHTAKIQ